MPEIKNASGKTFPIAGFRAEENEALEPLYHNEIVKPLLDSDTRQIAQEIMQSFPATQEMFKLRTRYFDDVLAQQIALGYQQVVILGSDPDTCAVRMAASGVRYFEIDQAATLQLKAERLKVNQIPAEVTYIPGDYIKDDLIALLRNNQFNFQLPTYFLWKGKVTYLKRGEIIAVIDAIRNHVRHFKLSIDYLSSQVIAKTTGYAELNDYADALAGQGTPWLTGFKDMSCFAKGLGLTIAENWSAAQLFDRYQPQLPVPSPLFKFYFVCTLERAIH